ncbi:nucleotidyltransferase family protein [Chromatocurvus halotolerans]|uniref:Molybdenum cofactor cytidylyltransferase n=1 Tax=Chromatocurvus halotolerans TaxID=1132028 RepID=A0A4V2SCA2_9GAMM|nr:nucleotidyltransferase family protein [Chromatocurvus halotolerans]TCO78610.1 molybdenum cofactor cytidylyltransferase [Chromatocurvus halotolerans]
MSVTTADGGCAGILLLAAGRGQRFGSDKRLARLPASGTTLLKTTLAHARASGMPVHVCLRTEDHALADALSQDAVSTRVCQRAHEGMGATLAEAVAGTEGWDAALVALADMPWVTATTYRALAEACRREAITVPRYRGRRGNPVCFGAGWFRALLQCGGDSGARDLLLANPRAILELDVDDAGILRDVDRPADLEAMR